MDDTMQDTAEECKTALPHDSMVTVRLSEPPALTAITELPLNQEPYDATPILETPIELPEAIEDDNADDTFTTIIRQSRVTLNDGENLESVPELAEEPLSPTTPRRGSNSTEESGEGEVDWAQLEKTEEQEPRNEESEFSTALLLARLEQENNALVNNPKTGLSPMGKSTRRDTQSRPPSMQQLRKMFKGPTPPSLRYSQVPAPPMTDLEFYTALVQDYERTAQRLPTLLSKKIRSGIPPPLRGVVWQSMSGARDRLLEEQYDRLCGESSPYEGMIGKDIGRSFPGVEMFQDAEGAGQIMLGKVLKAFSLYDHKIGYCQGLGFLVGPLLMHMGDKQAFCVLVRLMEHYDLRSCFLPDLSGLHVRIYQFNELLKKHLSKLHAHLEKLQVEPTYVSQWFLSFFAVTCPLPMLFRIYDVIFAEGASETIMRVALSLMRKNEEKILACTEFEDIMHLLLSRGLWDCYHYNADEFVDDFVSLTGVVTNDSLEALKASYQESRDTAEPPTSSIGSAASRFLGRLWSGGVSSTKSANLSPLNAPPRPISFLRRSNSKQSLASTVNSVEGVTDSLNGSVTTEATSMSRDSSNADSSSIRIESVVPSIKTTASHDKNLHGQIEDLLTALSEMQRDHSILVTQLQKEREQREEDHKAVKALLDGLRGQKGREVAGSEKSEESEETVTSATPQVAASDETAEADGEESTENDEMETPILELAPESDAPTTKRQQYLADLLDKVEERFAQRTNPRTSMLQSKSQLREEVIRLKEQLIMEVSKTQDLSRTISHMESDLQKLRDEGKEARGLARVAQQERQRLEKQLQEVRTQQSQTRKPSSPIFGNEEWAARPPVSSGLRELRLGKRNSNTPQMSTNAMKRSSSLSLYTPSLAGKENEAPSPIEKGPPSPDRDALVLELVQAKTAEAIAKQEAEEAKAKLEGLRKLLGMGPASPAANEGLGHKSSPSQPNLASSGIGGAFSSYMARVPSGSAEAKSPGGALGVSSSGTATATTPSPSAGGGGFWSGWGKRSVSSASVATVVPAAGVGDGK